VSVSAVPFPPFASDTHEWEWRGERLRGTRRAVALLAQPEKVGNRQVSVGLARIPSGQAAPWHLHEDHEEFVYVLEGRGEFWCQGAAAIRIGPGSVNIIPPGALHTHRALDEDLLFVWGYAPPGMQLDR
jgi:quercetin dioxygenase-like cupin family protein